MFYICSMAYMLRIIPSIAYIFCMFLWCILIPSIILIIMYIPNIIPSSMYIPGISLSHISSIVLSKIQNSSIIPSLVHTPSILPSIGPRKQRLFRFSLGGFWRCARWFTYHGINPIPWRKVGLEKINLERSLVRRKGKGWRKSIDSVKVSFRWNFKEFNNRNF